MIQALGETKSFWGCSAATDEVLVWRATAAGIRPRRPQDMLLFARAIGAANKYHAAVRAVLVKPLTASRFGIDVVMVPHYPLPYNVACGPIGMAAGGPQDGADLAKAVVAEPDVRATFPNLELTGYQLVELVGPPSSVDHWRAHSILWDRSALLGSGSSTAAYAKGDGVYEGAADDGAMAKPWSAGALPPLGPEPQAAATSPVLAIGLAAAAVLAGAYIFKGAA